MNEDHYKVGHRVRHRRLSRWGTIYGIYGYGMPWERYHVCMDDGEKTTADPGDLDAGGEGSDGGGDGGGAAESLIDRKLSELTVTPLVGVGSLGVAGGVIAHSPSTLTCPDCGGDVLRGSCRRCKRQVESDVAEALIDLALEMLFHQVETSASKQSNTSGEDVNG